MKKIKIGIPRAFTYHRYGVLWKYFFQSLGCKLVLSPETNQEILDLGINNTLDECCLSYKIYIGHVLYLNDKCDYLLISRICNYGKNDKVCTRFNEIYDKLSDANKVSVNIEKFIKMLNLKDYESAYKLLDSNFKKNNYPSIEAFKKYVEKNLFDYSKITTVNNSNKTGNYYITSLDLEDGESENIRKKQITIIMQLLEGTDFVMSFSMN